MKKFLITMLGCTAFTLVTSQSSLTCCDDMCTNIFKQCAEKDKNDLLSDICIKTMNGCKM